MGAALFVPLAMQLGPLVLQGIETLIKDIHSKVPPSPMNDPKKLTAVVDATIPKLQLLVDTGVIPALPADQVELRGMLMSLVQGIFTNLKNNKQLPPRPGDPPVPVPPTVNAPALPGPSAVAASEGYALPRIAGEVTNLLKAPITLTGTFLFVPSGS